MIAVNQLQTKLDLLQSSYLAVIDTSSGLDSCFPCDPHKREVCLWMGGRMIHLEGFRSNGRLNARQLNQVLEFQAALIYGAVAELL